jgi:molybdate transport system regulatory protein
MKYGARNQISATVTSIKAGDVMSQVDFDVQGPVSMASVLTSDSVAELGIKPGDRVKLVVKAIHVLVVRE